MQGVLQGLAAAVSLWTQSGWPRRIEACTWNLLGVRDAVPLHLRHGALRF